MLAVLNSKPIFSKDGKPVHGRFFVFQKDTNQKATVYTYDTENTLVEAQNPIYTDDFGFPEFEVILEDQIYSIVVEKYVGDYDDPKADQRTSSWDLVNSYYEGFVDDSKQNSGLVYGASSLADADIAQGTVDVVGYWNSFDCGQRTYVWDPESIDLEDGGYVVKSNKQSKGRWILVNDLPYIPSEYYGVIPGKLANMERLTSSPNQVGGSYKVNVPSCIKFASGTYNLTGMLITNSNGRNRSILVDNKTCFGDKWIVSCEGIIVLGEIRKDDGEYIGNLRLPACCPAKYSWFPNLDSFLDCAQGGSEVLIVDSYGINNEITKDHVLSFKTFKFEGGKIDWNAANGIYLTLDSCKVLGEKMSFSDGTRTVWWNGFSKNTRFKNMEYTDKYVLGTRNAYTVNCTKHIDNFKRLQNYIELCLDENEIIDLQGHVVDLFDIDNADQNITISNGTIEHIDVKSPRCNLTLENCTVNNLDMRVYGVENLVIKKSTVAGTLEATTINISDSTVLSSINCLETFSAQNCHFEGDIEAYTTHLYYCTVNGIVWPKADAGKITCVFVGNTFTTNSYIKLASKHSETQVKLEGYFENNAFFSSQHNGLFVEVFVRDSRYLNDDPLEHSWTWQGNSGTCLQTYCDSIMEVDMLNNRDGIKNLRYIDFGIPNPNVSPLGNRYANPVSIVLKKIPAEKTVGSDIVNPIEYIVTNDNQTSYFEIVKYSTSDYFAHRFYLGQGSYQGTYEVAVRQIGRG